jgi:hypothetical protein
MVLRSSTTLTAGRSVTSALSIRATSVVDVVGSGVAGVLVKGEQAEVGTAEVGADVEEVAESRLTALMLQTPLGISLQTSGNVSGLHDRTLHSSVLVLAAVGVPAVATVTTVILTDNAMRVLLTPLVTVILSLRLTVNLTPPSRSVVLRMVVVLGAGRTTVDSRTVLVTIDR